MDSNYQAHVKDLVFALFVTLIVGIVGDFWYASQLTPAQASCLVRHPYATRVLVTSEQTGESVAGSVCYVGLDTARRTGGTHAWLYFDYHEPR